MRRPPADVAATRAAYDTVAHDDAELLRPALDHDPLERAALAAFAGLVAQSGGGLVADLGCAEAHLLLRR